MSTATVTQVVVLEGFVIRAKFLSSDEEKFKTSVKEDFEILLTLTFKETFMKL